MPCCRKVIPRPALGDLNQVVSRHPEHVGGRSMRGATHLALGQPPEAIVDYRAVQQVSPDQPGANADLGLALYFAGEFAEAASYFSRAIELQPQMRFLKPWQYAALRQDGANEAARAVADEVTSRPADQRDWFDLLTLVLSGAVAEQELMAAVASPDDPRRDAQLCEAHYFLGLRQRMESEPDADDWFRRALTSPAKRLSAYRGAQYALGEFSQ